MRIAGRLCCLVAATALGTAALTAAAPVAHATSWVWPLPPPHQVVRDFAPPAHDWLPGHRGVDLAATAGEPVLAAGGGRVSFAGVIAGVGVVAVRHPGGLETTYEPVRPALRLGAAVAAGTQVGSVVTGGHCTGTCLHWGLRRGDDYLDPLRLVGAGRVRLLPITRSVGGWMVPAAGGASVGSSAVVLAWAARTQRRRRRRLPPGVADLHVVRARRQQADTAAC